MSEPQAPYTAHGGEQFGDAELVSREKLRGTIEEVVAKAAAGEFLVSVLGVTSPLMDTRAAAAEAVHALVDEAMVYLTGRA